jgi:chorismate mutase
VALALPLSLSRMKTPSARDRVPDLDPSRRPLVRRPSSSVTLWRPEVVLAATIVASPPPALVTVAGPSLRPEAVRTHLGSTQSVLGSLAAARQELGAQAAAARARSEQAASAREHVAAVIETYRAEARLDDVLAGAMREVTALMEERGLR